MPDTVIKAGEALVFDENRRVRVLREVTDDNARCVLWDLTPGDTQDVPVVMFGTGLAGRDLSHFNGITQPMLATLDQDGDSYVGLHHSADDTPVIRLRVNSGTVRNHTIPDVASDTICLIAATQTLSNKTFSGATLFGDGTVALPGIAFSGDTNTGLYRIGADNVGLALAGIKVVDFGAGATALYIGGANATAQEYAGYKSRGTVAVPTVITTGDDLLRIAGYGYDGDSYVKAAEILLDSEGTIADTRVGGRIIFRTGTDAAPTVLTDRLTVNAIGQVAVSTAAPQSLTVAGGAVSAALQVMATTTAGAQIWAAGWDAVPGALRFASSRHATIGSHTVVQNNDILGYVQFLGSDGTDYTAAAIISGEVDGTPGNDDMPGRLIFGVTADNAATTTERLRITAVGALTTQGATPTNTNVAGMGTFTGGVAIGADALANVIDDASNGAGSTALYIGNALILKNNGVNFGPAAVASITVVGGQITAIS